MWVGVSAKMEASGGGGEVTEEERRAGVSGERGLGQVSLREVRHQDPVVSSWERVNECSQVDLQGGEGRAGQEGTGGRVRYL